MKKKTISRKNIFFMSIIEANVMIYGNGISLWQIFTLQIMIFHDRISLKIAEF